MNDLVELAMTVDVTAAGQAVQVAAVTEAGRQADALLGQPPIPGSIEWHAEEGTDLPVQRERAWQLLQLRIGLAAGVDTVPTVIGLRNHGATWEQIAHAAGITRQSAHERWARKVDGLLNRAGDWHRDPG
ncbi:hypothetical protein WEH80_15975 [Actinomycetes bacterium KLBMP 9759]